jgi:hypothetical protein
MKNVTVKILPKWGLPRKMALLFVWEECEPQNPFEKHESYLFWIFNIFISIY